MLLRWIPLTLLSVCTLALSGCKREPVPELMLQTGRGQNYRFVATSGFAQYLERSGGVDTLRIVVASYPLRCDEYRPPPDGEVLVTVTITSPPGGISAPGRFPWIGAPTQAPGEEADKPPPVETASALPFVRLAEDARALPPGGRVSLLQLDKSPHGLVAGEFQFSDSSQGETANAALFGPFRVPLCDLDLDPLRPPEEEDDEEQQK